MSSAKYPDLPPPAYALTDAADQSTVNLDSLDRNQKHYYQILKNMVVTKNLSTYYSTDQQLIDIAKKLDPNEISNLAKKHNIKPRSAKLLAELCLFDLILYIDNSSSMNQGDRIDQLEETTKMIADCYLPFDIHNHGLSIVFMNGDDEDDHHNVTSAEFMEEFLEDVLYYGETPFASVLNNKIITPIKQQMSRDPASFRPKLVICVTDGSPTDKNISTENLIKDVKNFLKNHHRSNGVFFQFAQIGNDLASADFLQKLDEHRSFGDIVDVTSSFEVEQKQVAAQGGELNRSMWTLKLLLGAIDSEFDFIDESKER